MQMLKQNSESIDDLMSLYTQHSESITSAIAFYKNYGDIIKKYPFSLKNLPFIMFAGMSRYASLAEDALTALMYMCMIIVGAIVLGLCAIISAIIGICILLKRLVIDLIGLGKNPVRVVRKNHQVRLVANHALPERPYIRTFAIRDCTSAIKDKNTITIDAAVNGVDIIGEAIDLNKLPPYEKEVAIKCGDVWLPVHCIKQIEDEPEEIMF